MKRNTPILKEKKKYRFFKSHLASIVWDAGKERPLADFTEGHFTTDDPKVAAILKSKGYPQIPLDAEEPPNVIVNQTTQVLKEGANIPLFKPGMDPAVIQKRMEAITEDIVPKASTIDLQAGIE